MACVPWPLIRLEKMVTLKIHLLCSQPLNACSLHRQGRPHHRVLFYGGLDIASAPSEKDPLTFKSIPCPAACRYSVQASPPSFFMCFMLKSSQASSFDLISASYQVKKIPLEIQRQETLNDQEFLGFCQGWEGMKKLLTFWYEQTKKPNNFSVLLVKHSPLYPAVCFQHLWVLVVKVFPSCICSSDNLPQSSPLQVYLPLFLTVM